MFSLGKRSLERLEGKSNGIPLHPDMVEVVKRAIELSECDFTVICTGRTLQDQQDLYAQGRTKPGPIVTWSMNSQHLKQKTGYSHAVDLGAWVDGKISWDWEHYRKIAKAMKQAAKELNVLIDWGGDFTNPDGPHFQLKKDFYL